MKMMKNVLQYKRQSVVQEHIEYYYPHWKILEYDTDKEMAEAVKSGEADFFISSVTLASKYSRDPSFYSVPLLYSESSLCS